MLSFPRSSHHLPIGSLASHKADLRREITAWRLLVWAYRDERVQAASNIGSDNFALTDYAMSRLDGDRSHGGLINGVLEAHPDALMIDAKLNAWFEGNGYRLAIVIGRAERALPPPASIAIAMARPVARRNRDGSVAMELKKSNGRWMPYICLVDWEGEDASVVARKLRLYEEFYALFLAFLDAMPGFPLTKWRVTGRGLTQ